jgi:heat shock protein HslJ
VKKLIAGAVLAVLVGACGGSDDTPPPAPAGPEPDYEGVWTLESGRDESGNLPFVEGYPITLELDGNEARGSAACNSYGGGVDVTGSSFRAGGFAVTEIGCDPDVTESQDRYLAAIAAADTIAVDGSAMTLTGPDVTLTFDRVPPVETGSVVDTTWVLESLVEGAEPDAAVVSAARARLKLGADGAVAGTTGCRRFSGTWTEHGDEIVFSSMSLKGSCGEALAEQDQHVVAVLGGGFKPAVEGAQLTVTVATGDLGLVYRAR